MNPQPIAHEGSYGFEPPIYQGGQPQRSFAAQGEPVKAQAAPVAESALTAADKQRQIEAEKLLVA